MLQGDEAHLRDNENRRIRLIASSELKLVKETVNLDGCKSKAPKPGLSFFRKLKWCK